MAKVVVLGSINQDVTVTCKRAPLVGETVHGTSVEYFPGGKGSNQAVASARFGATVAFIGCVGNESAGQVMRSNFDVNGIDRSAVRICEDAPTGTALITIDGTGDNSIVVVPGANEQVGARDVEALRDGGFGAGDVLVCQLEVPRDTVAAALRVGHELGMTTVLNAAPADDVRDLLDVIDVLITNEMEIQPNIGGDFSSRAELTEQVGELARSTGTAVVVTLGGEGCVAVAGDDVADIRARSVDVVDTTGAGDTFVGVLAAVLADGKSLPEAVEVASAAGSLATTKKGAQSGMPTRAEVVDFQAQG
ncbi:MAG: ribokinase [Actinomycetaceae bacterium]|nr:ribokinase [Actinomycetaceae bacterium]